MGDTLIESINFLDFGDYTEENPYNLINNKEIRFNCSINGENSEQDDSISDNNFDNYFDIILENDDIIILEDDNLINEQFVLETYIDKDTFIKLNQSILIIANYGDGVEEYHTKPLALFDNKNSKWDSFTHKFNFKKDDFENNTNRKMIFTIYSRLGTAPISKELHYKIIDNSRVKLRLLNANLDNNGKISFMFDNIADGKSKIILAEIKK